MSRPAGVPWGARGRPVDRRTDVWAILDRAPGFDPAPDSRDSLRGFRLLEETPYLRHFTTCLGPV